MKKITLLLFILTILIISWCNNNLTDTEITQINKIINEENKKYSDMGEKFSWVPKYSWEDLTSQYLQAQQQSPGLDIFKMNMMNNIQTEDIDSKIHGLETKRWQLYATAVKDARSRWFDIDPKNLKTFLDKEEKAINNEIWYRQSERKDRLSEAEKEAEYQYKNLTNQLFLSRTKQLEIQKEIYQEYNERFKNNKKIKTLLNNLDWTNKEYEILKKQLVWYWIKDINIILRNNFDKKSN